MKTELQQECNLPMKKYVGKLKWRSRRSMLELDLLFDSYVKSEALEHLSVDYLDKYSELLELDDGELLALFHGTHILKDNKLQLLIDQIKNCNN